MLDKGHRCCRILTRVKGQNRQIIILQRLDLKNVPHGAIVSVHFMKLFLYLSPRDANVSGAEEPTAG